MKFIIVAACVGACVITASTSAVALPKNERFVSQDPAEPMARSRSAAVQIQQPPGSAAILLEALRWRGRTAQQIGVPSKLWCADFMNFVIKRAGAKGTGSRAARSFLQYGKVLDGPRVGAIAIFHRGPNNGHVGIVRGTDGQGNPIVVSGNHGKTVMQSQYPKERVLAYVMPPDYVLRELSNNATRAHASAR